MINIARRGRSGPQVFANMFRELFVTQVKSILLHRPSCALHKLYQLRPWSTPSHELKSNTISSWAPLLRGSRNVVRRIYLIISFAGAICKMMCRNLCVVVSGLVFHIVSSHVLPRSKTRRFAALFLLYETQNAAESALFSDQFSR